MKQNGGKLQTGKSDAEIRQNKKAGNGIRILLDGWRNLFKSEPFQLTGRVRHSAVAHHAPQKPMEI